MSDFNALLKSIKRAAVEAVEASKPVTIVCGNVTSVSPLKISIEQKISLGVKQLIISRNVTDFEIQMTVDGKRTSVTIHNDLIIGDEVILLRQQGGQKYVVLDRLAI